MNSLVASGQIWLSSSVLKIFVVFSNIQYQYEILTTGYANSFMLSNCWFLKILDNNHELSVVIHLKKAEK